MTPRGEVVVLWRQVSKIQDDFVAETGLGFSFIFILSEGASGNPR